jgi:hypothetical protein
MKRKHLVLFTTLLMIVSMFFSSTISAKAELEKKTFYLTDNLSGHLNIKLAKFDIYSHPKGFQKDLFFIPKLGDLIIDAKAGRIFEPMEFTKIKSTGSFILSYSSLNPIEGSRVELKQLHNKWNLKAQWKENTFLVSIPFKPNEKPSPSEKVTVMAKEDEKKQSLIPEKESEKAGTPAPITPPSNIQPSSPKSPDSQSPSKQTSESMDKDQKESISHVPKRSYPLEMAAVVAQFPGSEVLHFFGDDKEKHLILIKEGDHQKQAIEYFRDEMNKTHWAKEDDRQLGSQYLLSFNKDGKKLGVAISILNQITRIQLILKK